MKQKSFLGDLSFIKYEISILILILNNNRRTFLNKSSRDKWLPQRRNPASGFSWLQSRQSHSFWNMLLIQQQIGNARWIYPYKLISDNNKLYNQLLLIHTIKKTYKICNGKKYG